MGETTVGPSFMETVDEKRRRLSRETDAVAQNILDISDERYAEFEEQERILTEELAEEKQKFAELSRNYELLLSKTSVLGCDYNKAVQEKMELEFDMKEAAREKQQLAAQVGKQKAKITELNAALAKHQTELAKGEEERQQLKMNEEILRNEKEIFLRGKEFLIKELQTRDANIMRLNHEIDERSRSIHDERSRLLADKVSAETRIAERDEELAKLRKEFDVIKKKLGGIVDEYELEKREIEQTLINKEAIIQLYRDNEDKLTASADDSRAQYEEIAKLLKDARQAINDMKEETQEEMQNILQDLNERNSEICALKDELDSANELIKKKFNLTDDMISAFPSTSSQDDQLVREGRTVSEIYKQHKKMVAELKEEKQKTKLLEESMKDLISEFEERGPIFLQIRKDCENALTEKAKLEQELAEIEKRNGELISANDTIARELAFTKCELEQSTRDAHALDTQVSHLLFVIEKNRNSSMYRSTELESESEDGDRRLYNNIQQIQTRNRELEHELVGLRHQIQQELASANESKLDELKAEISSLAEKLVDSQGVVDRLTEEYEESQRLLSKYRDIVDRGGLDDDAATAKRKQFDAEQLLKAQKEKNERLEKLLEVNRKENKKTIGEYSSLIEFEKIVSAELRSTNNRLLFDLENQKQQAVANKSEYERTLKDAQRFERLNDEAEAALKAEQMHTVQLTGELEETRLQLDQYRRSMHRLQSESNECKMQLAAKTAELDNLSDNTSEDIKRLRSTQEVERRLHVVESSKMELLSSRLESLEYERNQLRTLNDVYVERINILEDLQTADYRARNDAREIEKRLSVKMAELEAANEKIRELTELIASSQQQPETSSSTSTNDVEEMNSEIHQLRNKNTYLTNQVEELKQALTTADNKIEAASSEAERLRVVTESLKASCNATEEALKKELESANEQIRMSAQMIEDGDKKRREMNDIILSYKEQVEKADGEAYTYKAENIRVIAQQQAKYDELEAKYNKLQAEQKDLPALEARMQSLEQQRSEAHERKELIAQEKAVLMTRLLSTANELNEARGEALDLRLKLAQNEQTTTAQLSALNQQLAEKENTIADLLKNQDGIQEMLEKIAGSIPVVSSSTSSAEDSPEIATRATSSLLARFRHEKMVAQRKQTSTEEELHRVRDANNTLTTEREQLQSTIVQLQAQLETQKTVTPPDVLARYEEQTANLQIKMKLLESSIEAIRGEKASVESALAENAAFLERMAKQLEAKQAEIANTTRHIAELQNRLAKESEAATSLKNESAAAKRSFEAALRAANEKIATLEKKLAEQESASKTAKGPAAEQALREIEELKKGNADLVTKCSQLKQLALKYKRQATEAGQGSSTQAETAAAAQPASTEEKFSFDTVPMHLQLANAKNEKEKAEALCQDLSRENEELKKQLQAMLAAQEGTTSEESKDNEDVAGSEPSARPLGASFSFASAATFATARPMGAPFGAGAASGSPSIFGGHARHPEGSKIGEGISSSSSSGPKKRALEVPAGVDPKRARPSAEEGAISSSEKRGREWEPEEEAAPEDSSDYEERPVRPADSSGDEQVIVVDLDREAASTLEEADDEGQVQRPPESDTPTDNRPSQSGQGEPRLQRVPITFQEECSSSNSSRQTARRGAGGSRIFASARGDMSFRGRRLGGGTARRRRAGP